MKTFLIIIAVIVGLWLIFGNYIKQIVGSTALKFGLTGGAPFDPIQRAKVRGVQSADQLIDVGFGTLSKFIGNLGSSAAPSGSGANTAIGSDVIDNTPLVPYAGDYSVAPKDLIGPSDPYSEGAA